MFVTKKKYMELQSKHNALTLTSNIKHTTIKAATIAMSKATQALKDSNALIDKLNARVAELEAQNVLLRAKNEGQSLN